jgi:hypothetical protein
VDHEPAESREGLGGSRSSGADGAAMSVPDTSATDEFTLRHACDNATSPASGAVSTPVSSPTTPSSTGRSTSTPGVPPLTKEQGIIVSAYTGYLACSFAAMQEEVEKRMGRPVWTHEFGSAEFVKQVKALFKDDFVAIGNKS